MNPAVSHETASSSRVARRLRPVKTLSMPRATIPREEAPRRQGRLLAKQADDGQEQAERASREREEEEAASPLVAPGAATTTRAGTAAPETARRRAARPGDEWGCRSCAARHGRRAVR